MPACAGRPPTPDTTRHPGEPQDAATHPKGPAMSDNYSPPPPPPRDPDGNPLAPQPGGPQPGLYPQGHTSPHAPQDQQRPGTPPYTPQPPRGNRTLFIVLGAVAAVVIIALVAVFAWVIPTLATPQGQDTPAPVATSPGTAEESAATEDTVEPTDAPAADDVPAGAIPLPPGWDDLKGPANIPAEGDPLFSRFVTGESSFQYLASWTGDDTFGISTDPVSGAPMQQKAQGTEELDADGIALAYAFFAEAEEGKHGKEPAKVQAAIKEIEAKFTAMPAADLPQNLVGHKCTSNFETTTPEIREFRRTSAVVIGFTCLNARGEAIQAINLFSVTPWGTPQMVGVSGHATYWAENPELLEQLGNSYRANRWKLQG